MAHLTEFPIIPKPIGSGHQYLLRNARAKARQLKYQAPYILMLIPAPNRLKICSERRSAKKQDKFSPIYIDFENDYHYLVSPEMI